MADEVLRRERLKVELEKVRAEDKDGMLHPEKVVAWAKAHSDSELFREFEWDDSAAAEKYRIGQARQVIRVVVVNVENTPEPVRVYLSTPTDRLHGGGYRDRDDALRRARQELINEALTKIQRLRHQFTHLPELAPLFDRLEQAAVEFRTAKLAS